MGLVYQSLKYHMQHPRMILSPANQQENKISMEQRKNNTDIL